MQLWNQKYKLINETFFTYNDISVFRLDRLRTRNWSSDKEQYRFIQTDKNYIPSGSKFPRDDFYKNYDSIKAFNLTDANRKKSFVNLPSPSDDTTAKFRLKNYK